jgi:hypothetical protein
VLLAAELFRESTESKDRRPGIMLRGIGNGGFDGRFPEMSFLMFAAAKWVLRQLYRH